MQITVLEIRKELLQHHQSSENLLGRHQSLAYVVCQIGKDSLLYPTEQNGNKLVRNVLNQYDIHG